MENQFRTFVEDLRIFARLTDADGLGLSKAGEMIDEHIQAMRDAVRKEAERAPDSQSKFWSGVTEIINNRLRRSLHPD